MKAIGKIVCAFCAASLLALALAPPAGAKVVNLYVYNGVYPGGSFSGGDAVGASGFTEPSNIAVNDQTGDVYVGANGLIYHLNAAGASQPFSSVAPSTVISRGTYGLGSVKVDNSGTATQGRIYAKEEYSDLSAYEPSGAAVPGFPLGGLGDGCGLDIAPDSGIWAANYGDGAHRYSSSGTNSNEMISFGGICGFAIDSQEDFYIPGYGGSSIRKYNRTGELLQENWGGEGKASENLAIDRSNDNVFAVMGDHVNEFNSNGELVGSFGFSEGAKSYPGLSGAEGIAVNSTTHEVYVGNTYGSGKIDTFVQTGPVTIPDATTEAAAVTPTTATLKGLVDPDAANAGTPITGCRFEWGKTPEYDHVTACDQAMPLGSPTHVTATISGLQTAATYHFRITANNANAVQSNGGDMSFQPSGPPTITNEAASEVFSDGATMNADIDAAGSTTSYHFEWGTAPCSANPCTSVPSPDDTLKKPVGVQAVRQVITGLTPGSTYYWRIIAVNNNSTVVGPDQQFTTFPLNPPAKDTCENALVRKQTGASLVPDCRAYELVSAPDTGGYDVESSLVPGQSPLAGYPGATDPPRALYTVHYGAIPGIGDPPNFGDDPYVATRTSSGWTTRYVGIPVTGTPDPDNFGSTMIGADAGLNAYAFGGSHICNPCFEDGSSGIPIRLPDGELVQGMQGSLKVASPEPAGNVANYFSADGKHFIFGSEQKLEPAGNPGSVSIYDRDLTSGKTQVVSTMPDGSTMSGELAELDVSADGSRILIGRLVGTDSAGNRHYDLYMHIGSSPQSVAVADTPNGVLYDGMTSDGTKVYFSTADALADDTDTSVDLFRAEVAPSSATVSRVSTGAGATGNTNGCAPSDEWNTVEGGPDCGILAVAGGGGVASGDGTVYFLSPELLDGPSNGSAGEPNLFVFPSGAGSPTFVATLEVDDPIIEHARSQAGAPRTEDFQVTANGNFAAMTAQEPITGFPVNGHSEVYRYDVAGNSLACASCAPTNARAESDATLPHNGGGITSDGRVFFTTADPLNLRDLNGGKTDVYEWNGNGPKLVSTGTSEFDSGLLSASEDGSDVLFFTHDLLVAGDENGHLVKVYDARENGGFYVQLKEPPCRASDECHGPGTQAPPPPDIGTYKGIGGQTPVAAKPRCRGHRVVRHGACVKKRHAKRHPKRHKRHGSKRPNRRHG